MLTVGKGAAGNVGAYAMGVPAGILIDTRGTRIAVLLGAVALACGYFPIHTGTGDTSSSNVAAWGLLTASRSL